MKRNKTNKMCYFEYKNTGKEAYGNFSYWFAVYWL